MSNGVALVLGTVLAALLVADWVLFEAAGLVFLGRRLADLIEYLAFWR